YQRGMDAAMRYLSYRPRSKTEVKDKLQHRAFAEETIDRILERLEELGLIDDSSFARFWQENRQTFSPRSQWLVRTELQRKGVDRAIIESTAPRVDDGDSAYRAASGRARRLKSLDYPNFRRRLGDFLKRRGFGYEVIQQTIHKIWQEHQGGSAQPPNQ
ncbi:regulatory protein RecX, partial [Chloroflexota bacterium]